MSMILTASDCTGEHFSEYNDISIAFYIKHHCKEYPMAEYLL